MANQANGATMRKQFTSKEDGRLDKVISDHTKLSRKRARKVVEAGGVRVNGKKAKFSSQFVPAGSKVEFQSSTPANTEYTVDVCYKDDAVVVVNKPEHQLLHRSTYQSPCLHRAQTSRLSQGYSSWPYRHP